MEKRINNTLEEKKKQNDNKLLKEAKVSNHIELVQAFNPMVFHPRFPHISEQIFGHMDKKSLKNCRTVAKSWQNCIDNQNILWNKIVKKNDGTKSLQLALSKEHFKVVMPKRA